MAADALHGFIECSDGRLHHPAIADKAIESGSKKKKQGKQTAAATEAARLARLRRDAERNGQRDGVGDGIQGIGSDKKRDKDQEKGEGVETPPSRPDLKVVEEDKPQLIDESYEPSDRAVEYALSLGMKKADLNAELSKFIAMSMATRVVSFNPDMNFKVWCDGWFEFKRKKDPNWKPGA